MAIAKNTQGLSAASQAKTARGATFSFAEDGQSWETADWTKVDGMKSGVIPVAEQAEAEVTTLDSTSKEYIPILGDNPDLTIDLDYYPHNLVHQRLLAELSNSTVVRWWKIEIPDSITFYVQGYVKGWPVSFTGDSAMTATLTIKTSGKPVYKLPDSGVTLTWSGTLTGANLDGSVTGEMTGVLDAGSVSGVIFTDAVSDMDTFVAGVHYEVANVPVGLSPVLTKTDSKNIKLTFTGNANVKETVSNIEVRLTSKAFEGIMASSVNGYAKTDVTITFSD